jgi:ABC-type multidrug transport system fused ATPase/permease subunit
MLAQYTTQAGRAAPILSASASFLFMAVNDYDMNPPDVFAALSVFLGLRQALIMLPMSLTLIGAIESSLVRLQEFLAQDEVTTESTTLSSAGGSCLPTDVDQNQDAGVSPLPLVSLSRATFGFQPAIQNVAGAPYTTIEMANMLTSKEDLQYQCNPNLSDSANSVAVRDIDNDNDNDEKKSSSSIRENFQLKDVDFQCHASEIIAVVGTVASGKTTFLHALCGEMFLTRGQAGSPSHRSDGSNMKRGYVCQNPIVMSDTVLNNILMGRPYDASKLKHVLHGSALDQDVENMEHGLDTAVGEKGVTLSGGQQMRLNIARAIYDTPDLLVADDPLASVDAHVADELFTNFCALAKQDGCCVVIAMNQLHFLHKVDRILVLEDGSVVEQGTYKELASHGARFQQMMSCVQTQSSHGSSENEKDVEGSLSLPCSIADATSEETRVDPAKGKSTKLQLASKPLSRSQAVKEEPKASGSVSGSVFKEYVAAMGHGYFATCILLTMFAYAVMGASDRWLATWVDQKQKSDITGEDSRDTFYIIVYALLCVFFFVSVQTASAVFTVGGVRSTKTLHDECLWNLFHGTISFFNGTPSGRILSRFGTDLSNIDIFLTQYIDNTSQFGFSILVLLAVICALVPVVLILLIPASGLFWFQIVAVDRSGREGKRLCNNSMSPVLTCATECASARILVRVMGFQDYWDQRFSGFVDDYTRFNFFSSSVINWGMLFSYSVSFFISLGTAAGVLLQTGRSGAFGLSPSEAGLALTYSFGLPYFLLFLSYNITVVKIHLTSCERLLQLKGAWVKREPAWNLPDDPIEEEWPTAGEVQFKNVTLQYQRAEPGAAASIVPAVRNLSLNVGGSEKIGICGRTGAGKSSLVNLLFRIYDPTTGSICIDGKDLSTIGLQTLRERMNIIPQHPLIIEGTVSFNLDPFKTQKHSALIDVMRRVGLPKSLMGISASRLSAGQQQLLTLARILLNKKKVVVLDEPTAQIDVEMDAKIQEILAREFSDSTMITIAHRINSILPSDRVIVMEQGEIEESGSPQALLQKTSSSFAKLHAQSEH